MLHKQGSNVDNLSALTCLVLFHVVCEKGIVLALEIILVYVGHRIQWGVVVNEKICLFHRNSSRYDV